MPRVKTHVRSKACKFFTDDYLEAAFTLDDEAPLFPGEIVLQRDGALVGRGRLALTVPGDKVTLGFGADDRIKVARVPVSRQESGPSFLNSTKQDTREFKTSIKNLHDRPMHIRVLDQVPYAENTAIQVEMLPQTTSPSEQTVSDRRGVMAWVFDLPPGSEKELRLGYRLRWPADREVVLLPRPLLQPR